MDAVECMSGDLCSDPAIESSMFPGIFRFCRLHQDQLDLARDEMKTEAHKKSVKNKEGVNERYCETDGCPNRPVYGSDYCSTCSGDD